jgi:hypothetical protein
MLLVFDSSYRGCRAEAAGLPEGGEVSDLYEYDLFQVFADLRR